MYMYVHPQFGDDYQSRVLHNFDYVIILKKSSTNRLKLSLLVDFFKILRFWQKTRQIIESLNDLSSFLPTLHFRVRVPF